MSILSNRRKVFRKAILISAYKFLEVFIRISLTDIICYNTFF